MITTIAKILAAAVVGCIISCYIHYYGLDNYTTTKIVLSYLIYHLLYEYFENILNDIVWHLKK